MRNSEGQSVKSDLRHKGPRPGGSGHGTGLPTALTPSVRITLGDIRCQWGPL